MSYQHEHIPIYDAATGFNLLSKSFFAYHKKLEAKELSLYEKYLPRTLKDKHILDLGAGDGRLAKKFVGKGVASYYCVDIAEELLAQIPSRCSKQHADISQPLELEQDAFDVIFAFHVLLHIADIQSVFENIARYLAPNGIAIIAHHNERRPTLYEAHGKSFKIESYFHSDAAMQQAAVACGLQCLQHPVNDTCFFVLRHRG